MIESENGSRLDVDLKGEVYEGCRQDTQMTLEAESANTSHRDRSFKPSSRWSSLPRQVSDNATNQAPREVGLKSECGAEMLPLLLLLRHKCNKPRIVSQFVQLGVALKERIIRETLIRGHLQPFHRLLWLIQ
jgi:hypothetical protein